MVVVIKSNNNNKYMIDLQHRMDWKFLDYFLNLYKYINIQLIWTRINTEYGILVSNFIPHHIYIVSILFVVILFYFLSSVHHSYHFRSQFVYYDILLRGHTLDQCVQWRTHIHIHIRQRLCVRACVCVRNLYSKSLPWYSCVWYAQFCWFHERFTIIQYCNSQEKEKERERDSLNAKQTKMNIKKRKKKKEINAKEKKEKKRQNKIKQKKTTTTAAPTYKHYSPDRLVESEMCLNKERVLLDWQYINKHQYTYSAFAELRNQWTESTIDYYLYLNRSRSV